PATFRLSAVNAAMPEASLMTLPPPVRTPVPTSTSDTLRPATPLPNASATLTCTAGAMATPATTFVGATANVSAAAAAADTVNVGLVTDGKTPPEAVSCLIPATFTLSAGNVATPFASLATAPPPVSVPVPTSASATACPGTAFPNASVTRT